MYVCLLCWKLCSYRVLLWWFTQGGGTFGWTPLLRCYLMYLVPSLRVLCFVPTLSWCFWCFLVCSLLCKEERKQLLRRGIWAYMKCSCLCLCFGFEMGTMLANFYMCGIMLFLGAVLNMLVRNASPRGPICFRCLMFSLSGPCELLCLLCFIASWTWVVVSVMLYPCIFNVALLMEMFVLCVVCCLFDSVCELLDETIHNIFGCGCWVWLLFCCWMLWKC